MTNQNKIVVEENIGGNLEASRRAAPERPALALDVEKYQFFLEESDLSEEQKREFLETLWSIIVGFVDLGFGVHPLQQACGQLGQKSMEVLDFEAAAMISSDDPTESINGANDASENRKFTAERKEI